MPCAIAACLNATALQFHESLYPLAGRFQGFLQLDSGPCHPYIVDFGLASFSEQKKQDLLEAIEERYGAGATILASQLLRGAPRMRIMRS